MWVKKKYTRFFFGNQIISITYSYQCYKFHYWSGLPTYITECITTECITYLICG